MTTRPTQDGRSRDLALDAIKGWLIVLVCMGHVPLFWAHFPQVVIWLYTFHVPLFLAVSCTRISVRGPGDLPLFLRKRTVQLLLPFLTWVMIYSLLAWVTGRVTYGSVQEASIRLGAALGLANIGTLRAVTGTALLWFLPCLYSTNLLFAGIRSRFSGTVMALLAASMIYVISYAGLGFRWQAFMPWGIDAAVYVMPLCMVVTGIYPSGRMMSWPVLTGWTISAACLGYGVYAFSISRGLQSMILPDRWWLSLMCDLFCISMFVAAYGLAARSLAWTGGARVARPLAFIGRNSFGIYVTHPLVFATLGLILGWAGVTEFCATTTIGLAMLFTSIAAGFGVWFSQLVGCSRGLALVLLGSSSRQPRRPTPVCESITPGERKESFLAESTQSHP